MNPWKELLDRMVARDTSKQPPPCVVNLGLPPADFWEPGLVKAKWDVDPRFFHDRSRGRGRGLRFGFLAYQEGLLSYQTEGGPKHEVHVG